MISSLHYAAGNWKDDYNKNKKVFNNFFFTLLLIVVAMVPTLLQCLRDSSFLSRYMFITSSIKYFERQKLVISNILSIISLFLYIVNFFQKKSPV